MSAAHCKPTQIPYAWGTPEASALPRAVPEDFQVDEEPLRAPSGNGEHLWLRVRKRDANTEWAARRLARVCGIKSAQVGYAGLKDRHAVTTQWFSLHVGHNGTAPDWSAALRDSGLEVLEQHRHTRKLRRGALRANHFHIVLRALRGERAVLSERLKCIAEHGVPNYFGEQRFGRGGGNLEQAAALFAGTLAAPRHQRGLYLSAARAYLFNQVLAARVAEHTWNTGISGDVMQLRDSGSVFSTEELEEELRGRVQSGDIHPCGPLWGSGRRMTQHAARRREDDILMPHTLFREGLENAGLKQEYRALRLPVRNLSQRFEGDDLHLLFTLPPGTYATTVIREIVSIRDERG